MPPVELTFEEAMSVVALLEEVGDGVQVPYLSAASKAAEKLRAQLPAAVFEAVDEFAGGLHIDLARSSADDSARDVYDDVRQALTECRVLRCRYDSPKRPNEADDEFEFHPYALWFCQRTWYAVGHHGGRGAVRRLKLNRFLSMYPTDRTFAIPPDFDLHDDLGLAWRMIRGQPRCRVRVRFDPPFADAASETRWHPTQEEEWDDNGRVTLSFTVDGLDEIVWWVLGYGPGATVLEPVELIQRIRDLASGLIQK
ncbi:MAG: WYL domain-containing protein [Tepidisphaeraceae bacterium]